MGTRGRREYKDDDGGKDLAKDSGERRRVATVFTSQWVPGDKQTSVSKALRTESRGSIEDYLHTLEVTDYLVETVSPLDKKLPGTLEYPQDIRRGPFPSDSHATQRQNSNFCLTSWQFRFGD
ncbi:hypothetical protein RUM44_013742 [Polyplax serrata]|uniref:Uncharacterized protein n=1 Tax=Polyplax serrata TaxID=468196 RepID=A0ABR1BGW8_POLSC